MNKTQQDKWNRLLNGEILACSDDDMDSFPFHERLCSVFSSQGTLDRYTVSIKSEAQIIREMGTFYAHQENQRGYGFSSDSPCNCVSCCEGRGETVL